MNFYNLVNDEYIKKNPIPPHEKSWGVFKNLELENKKRLLKFIFSPFIADGLGCLLNKSCKKEKINLHFFVLQMQKLFISYYNYKNSEKSTQLFDHLFFISTTDQNNFTTIQDKFIFTCYELNKCGISVPIELGINIDYKNNKRYLLFIDDGGITLPEKYYYEDNESLSCLYKLISLYFDQKQVEIICLIEKEISRIMSSSADKNDTSKIYNLFSLTELNQKFGCVSWALISKLYFQNSTTDIWIKCPQYIHLLLTDVLNKFDLEQWNLYFKWRIVCNFCNFVSPCEYFHIFEKKLVGRKKPVPDVLQALNLCQSYYGFLLCIYYRQEYFSSETELLFHKLVAEIKTSFIDRIKANQWMKRKTKDKAISKIKKIKWKIGGRDFMKEQIDFDTFVTLVPHISLDKNDFFQNLIDLNNWSFQVMLNKHNKVIEPNEWFMYSYSVNAYYSGEMNEMVFPAGILQKPFFSTENSIEKNIAGIGMVISHELTHAFDNNGSKFNELGQLEDWWTAADKKNFEKKKIKIVELYSQIKIGEHYINGELTVNENIADITALRISFMTCLKFTKNKKKLLRYFVHFARCFCNYASDEYQILSLQLDPHSPQSTRVNVPLAFFDYFYTVLGVDKPKNYSNEIDVY